MAEITAGLSILCSDLQNNGGIKALYLANRDEVTSLTAASHTISAATMVTDKEWYELDFRGEMTSKVSWEVAAEGKLSSINTTLEIVIPKMTATNLAFVESVRSGCGFIVAAEYYNGTKILLGWDSKVGFDAALYLSGGSAEGGATISEKQQITLTLTGSQIETPYAYTFIPAV